MDSNHNKINFKFKLLRHFKRFFHIDDLGAPKKK